VTLATLVTLVDWWHWHGDGMVSVTTTSTVVVKVVQWWQWWQWWQWDNDDSGTTMTHRPSAMYFRCWFGNESSKFNKAGLWEVFSVWDFWDLGLGCTERKNWVLVWNFGSSGGSRRGWYLRVGRKYVWSWGVKVFSTPSYENLSNTYQISTKTTNRGMLHTWKNLGIFFRSRRWGHFNIYGTARRSIESQLPRE
jgi:hypothetical protein